MSNFPHSFDNEHSLYNVQDSLRTRLAHDHYPGDRTIFVDDDISNFPDSGIITLVDQVGDSQERAISFHYGRKGDHAFLDINLAESSRDSFKPRKLTSVVMQVRAEQHNAIKTAIINIEKFIGTKRDEDSVPFGPTLIGRLNFLNKIANSPKAWFVANRTYGLVPMEVTFKSQSHGTSGPVGMVTYEWDFGDGTNMSTLDPTIQKVYTTPGLYNVSLTVSNNYGSDTVTLQQFIKARIEAPNEAVINLEPQEGQLLIQESPEVPPVLRTPVGQLVNVSIKEGENPNMPGYSYAGEILDNGRFVDPVAMYTWFFSDDLPHSNSPTTKAGYRVGGLHDLVLRVDTQLGAYRITTYQNCIDVVEIQNLWLWLYHSDDSITATEFGLNSEVFKTQPKNTLNIRNNNSFLDDVPNYSRQKKEFFRNCGIAPLRTETSGSGGDALLFWASGRRKEETPDKEKIEFIEYNAFSDIYVQSGIPPINRIWNWASLISPLNVYIILGDVKRHPPSISPTNQSKVTIDLMTTMRSEEEIEGYNYVNGAQELQYNQGEFNRDGDTTTGHFSMYRTTWSKYAGYLIRSEWLGTHFAFKGFYKTEGVLDEPFMNLVKLIDVPEGGRKEGQLVALETGIYLFSNTGSALVYDDEAGIWQTTATSQNIFSYLHDYKSIGYDDETNTLLAASDKYHHAYLSFDYSTKAFIKFTDIDLSFSTLGGRPQEKQWQLSIY